LKLAISKQKYISTILILMRTRYADISKEYFHYYGISEIYLSDCLLLLKARRNP